MKDILFITFDYHEKNKPIKSVAVATLEAYLKENIKNIDVETFSFNMNDESTILFKQMSELSEILKNSYDYICISFYVWNIRFLNRLLSIIKNKNSSSILIAGGYEVNKSTIATLVENYNQINHFIIGYAEESLLNIIENKEKRKVLSNEVNNDNIPAIYSNGITEVDSNSIVRLETKRGCPANCSFCAYKNNDHKKITTHNFNKITKELSYLNKVNVKKVNILDPIFTIRNYNRILDYLIEIGFKPRISLQVKFEVIYPLVSVDDLLLKKLSNLDVILEFGLQSIDQRVLGNIERTNDLDKIKCVVQKLNKYNIEYEISVIRGLPGETPSSFEKTLLFLQEINCTKYVVFPLSLLTNTKMYDEREQLCITSFEQGGIEYVYETYSYDYSDYIEMLTSETKIESL